MMFDVLFNHFFCHFTNRSAKITPLPKNVVPNNVFSIQGILGDKFSVGDKSVRLKGEGFNPEYGNK